ncbi:MAG: peptidylprolyl isomerase [Cytophagaceae bacterium]
MKIEKNKVVSVSYNMQAKDQNGETHLQESVDAQQPMVFIFGMSGLPEKFEAELDGKKTGEKFDFTISYEEGYGDFEEEAVVTLSKDIFKIDGKFDDQRFQPGTVVPMQDSEGNHLRGRIVEVGAADLVVDFNHPLAGLDLEFKGEVVEIREATPEEIDHGHVHGPGGHHH